MKRIHTGTGFIAALDQSGGSTPKALLQYGVPESSYSGSEEMFARIHEMRTRVITSSAFNSQYILGAILFENTMNRTILGRFTADYLWEQKGVVPFLKVDSGLADAEDGVQLMKPISSLDDLLKKAVEKNIFGTKMRSVIKEANTAGIKKIVEQQFDIGRQISDMGLIPIIEPEVDINSATKMEAETILEQELQNKLAALDKDMIIMLKLSIPTEDDFYGDLMDETHILRIVALSGGYSQSEANERLSRNHKLIASFSRALLQGLTAGQTDEEFNMTLEASIKAIYEASVT